VILKHPCGHFHGVARKNHLHFVFPAPADHPGNNSHPPSRLRLLHIQPYLPFGYRTLSFVALSSDCECLLCSFCLSGQPFCMRLPPDGWYLLAATNHPIMDTLAVRLTVPPARPVGDSHPRVCAPCWAHTPQKRGAPKGAPLFSPV